MGKTKIGVNENESSLAKEVKKIRAEYRLNQWCVNKITVRWAGASWLLSVNDRVMLDEVPPLQIQMRLS